MKQTSVNPRINTLQVGSFARACLQPGQRGKVLACFTKAIYLITETGDILWIAGENTPMHRRCLQISSSPPKYTTGSMFYMQEHRLIINADIALDTTSAPIWDAPQRKPDRIPEISQLYSRLENLFSHLDHSRAGGFGACIPQILSLSTGELINPPPKIDDPILRFAQPFVLDMARACLEHNTVQITRIADELIGLGTGLTPSGDDFLGGMCFAMKILQAAYPESMSSEPVIQIEPYRSRTHLISFALLSDNAMGYAIEPMHNIINGLLCGESVENISPLVSQLIRLGHTTGWDLLTGLLTGLLLTNPDNYLIPV